MTDIAARRAILKLAAQLGYVDLVEQEFQEPAAAPVEPEREGLTPSGAIRFSGEPTFADTLQYIREPSASLEEGLTPEEAQRILHHSDIEASHLLEVKLIVAKLRRIAGRDG